MMFCPLDTANKQMEVPNQGNTIAKTKQVKFNLVSETKIPITQAKPGGSKQSLSVVKTCLEEPSVCVGKTKPMSSAATLSMIPKSPKSSNLSTLLTFPVSTNSQNKNIESPKSEKYPAKFIGNSMTSKVQKSNPATRDSSQKSKEIQIPVQRATTPILNKTFSCSSKKIVGHDHNREKIKSNDRTMKRKNKESASPSVKPIKHQKLDQPKMHH